MCNKIDESIKIFEKHVEILKTELDIDPIVLKGNEAKEYIAKNGSCLGQTGGFVSKDNTVAIINPERIGTLTHEMRHAWQYKNNFHSDFPKNKLLCMLLYLANPKEFDANKYALDYCKRMGFNEMAKDYKLKIKITVIPVCIYKNIKEI